LREGLSEIWLAAMAWPGLVLLALLLAALALCLFVARDMADLRTRLEQREAELDEAHRSLDASQSRILTAESKARMVSLVAGGIEERLARVEALVLGSETEDLRTRQGRSGSSQPPRLAVVEDAGGGALHAAMEDVVAGLTSLVSEAYRADLPERRRLLR
jgi:hypothetical protein